MIIKYTTSRALLSTRRATSILDYCKPGSDPTLFVPIHIRIHGSLGPTTLVRLIISWNIDARANVGDTFSGSYTRTTVSFFYLHTLWQPRSIRARPVYMPTIAIYATRSWRIDNPREPSIHRAAHYMPCLLCFSITAMTIRSYARERELLVRPDSTSASANFWPFLPYPCLLFLTSVLLSSSISTSSVPLSVLVLVCLY